MGLACLNVESKRQRGYDEPHRQLVARVWPQRNMNPQGMAGHLSPLTFLPPREVPKPRPSQDRGMAGVG